MKLSTKTRYGVRAVFDIAYHNAGRPTQARDIARRQEGQSPRRLARPSRAFLDEGLPEDVQRGGHGPACVCPTPPALARTTRTRPAAASGRGASSARSATMAAGEPDGMNITEAAAYLGWARNTLKKHLAGVPHRRLDARRSGGGRGMSIDAS